MTTETSVQRSFAHVVFALDGRLRRRSGVFDFIASPDWILRAKLERAGRRILLRDGVRLDATDRIVDLHFRNEYFPPMGADGATLARARRAARLMDVSLKQLCAYLESRDELDAIRAVRAVWELRSL